MPYTSHGHPFGVIDADAERPRADRCGGTALCPQCKSEAGHAMAAAGALAVHEGFLLGVIWRDRQAGVVLWCQLDPECEWHHGRLTSDSSVLTLGDLVREANAHAVTHEQPEPAGEPT